MSALIPQRRIGLTGGIASGKSSVGKLLQEKYGLLVLDADHYARAALAPGTTASQAVLKRYGQKLFCGDHLDRRALGDLVFNNPTERAWLNKGQYCSSSWGPAAKAINESLVLVSPSTVIELNEESKRA